VRGDDPEARARVLIGNVADGLHQVAHPGDEIGRSSEDAPVLDPIVRELNDLEDMLAPGIGRADTAQGLPKLREIVSRIEGLLMSPRQGVVFLSMEGRRALENAINRLREVERLYA
jgi:hypothetical protein